MTKEVFDEQIDKSSVDEKTGRTKSCQCLYLPITSGVFLHCVEYANNDEAKYAFRIERASRNQTNGLTNWCCGAECDNENPRPDCAVTPGHFGNAASKSKTLESLMEQDGDQEHNVAISSRERHRNTHKHRVEQDSSFQHADVGSHLLIEMVVGLRFRYGCGTMSKTISDSRVAFDISSSGCCEDKLLLSSNFVIGARLETLGDVSVVCWPRWGDDSRPSIAAMGMASDLCVQVKLDDEESKHGSHHDDTGKWSVLFDEEVWKTWVEQVAECCWEQLYLLLADS